MKGTTEHGERMSRKKIRTYQPGNADRRCKHCNMHSHRCELGYIFCDPDNCVGFKEKKSDGTVTA